MNRPRLPLGDYYQLLLRPELVGDDTPLSAPATPPVACGFGPRGLCCFPRLFGQKRPRPGRAGPLPRGIPENERRVRDAAPYNSGRTENIPSPDMQNGRPSRAARLCLDIRTPRCPPFWGGAGPGAACRAGFP